jgi:hypothetical protein
VLRRGLEVPISFPGGDIWILARYANSHWRYGHVHADYTLE